MFLVHVGYFGDSCAVCGKSEVDLLQPIVVIEYAGSEGEERRIITTHRVCLVKRINEAIEKFDAAFKVIDK